MVRSLGLPGVRAAVIDGDTPAAERSWARAHASYLLTTPDMLHHMLLPRHSRWDGFLRRLQYVIVDECHGYRGVFGSHVAHVLRRCAGSRSPCGGRPGPTGRWRRAPGGRGGPGVRGAPRDSGHVIGTAAGPVFILASATISEPGRCARLLTGLDAEAVTESAAPRGPAHLLPLGAAADRAARRGRRAGPAHCHRGGGRAAR